MDGVTPNPPAEVLRVGDGEIDRVGFDDVLQVVGDNAAAGRSEDVPDEEYVHLLTTSS